MLRIVEISALVDALQYTLFSITSKLLVGSFKGIVGVR